MSDLPYLAGYAPALLDRVRELRDGGKLRAWIEQRHPDRHAVQTDKALYQYVDALRQRHMRNAPLLSRVQFDSQQHPMRGTLGTHTFVSRTQGGKLKAKHEIRIAALFRDAPAAFLQMIVVHELAHMKEKDHNKAFYQLCCHMEPDYHQLEFDMRVWLTWRENAI